MTYHLWLVQRQEGKLFCLLSLTSDLTDTQCLKHLESKMEKGACQKDKVLLCGDSSGSPSLHKVEESTYPFFITSFVNKKKKKKSDNKSTLSPDALFSLPFPLPGPTCTNSHTFSSPYWNQCQLSVFIKKVKSGVYNSPFILLMLPILLLL